ncbi:glutathione-disulfide reductase [Stigmatella aurantiaca]|uniref:Glutathione reductase n=1 Tax=Stigmatella aurantiaca (strain DW4/3-1) TaxID=378806 RepID=Q09CD9_STIAD|nr:glutathione-disulfide reductase [Stigmatella aurantiaca]ADO69589.1 Glutathione-disulfide reductase [Stigmatella aurantiaca DW4/3-1]EAU69395.1 glutathione-disulfide reductase [Stigmatella aurantiaca DW4/3-1]
MAQYDFDLLTIGGGSGGTSASRRAGALGKRVALCEEDRVGGTCVLRGCVPKKLLVYGSHFREEFEDAAGYGWTVPSPTLDWKKLQEAKNREMDRLNDVYKRLLRDAGVRLIEGRARILDAHTVEAGGQRYTAAHLLIATGSRPAMPSLPGIEHVLSSDGVLSLPELPRRMIIVGGGYIGVEFASIFNGLGTQVTLLVREDTVLKGFDEDVRSVLSQELRKKGIDLRCGASVRDVEMKADGIRSVLTKTGDTLEAEVVLFATGRVPNTRGFGLEDVGVKLDEHGAVVVDDASHSSVPHIHAVGDVTNRLNLTPVAIAEGRALVETLFHGNPTRVDHSVIPSAVFTQPPVGTVGLTEQEAREKHGAVDVYVSSFRPMRHTVSGRNEGAMMKVLTERDTGRVLGFHMVGVDAPEILQGLAVAFQCGVTKKQLDAAVGIHPTAAEEFVTLSDKRS